MRILIGKKKPKQNKLMYLLTWKRCGGRALHYIYVLSDVAGSVFSSLNSCAAKTQIVHTPEMTLQIHCASCNCDHLNFRLKQPLLEVKKMHVKCVLVSSLLDRTEHCKSDNTRDLTQIYCLNLTRQEVKMKTKSSKVCQHGANEKQ